jgi:hypothetical protein
MDGRTLRLSLASGETLVLSRLGARLDDCRAALERARAEALLDALWMREEERFPPVAAQQIAEERTRPCELRLLETALVVLYPDALPVRLPYALIGGIGTADHRVALDARWMGRWTFARLGRSFDPFAEALSAALNGLQESLLGLLRRVLPSLDPPLLRAAAGLLRDGVTVPVEAVRAANLWQPLLAAATAAGSGDELGVLAELADGRGMRAGLKHGLAGPLSGDYLFVLAPLAGGAAALEAIRLDGPEEGPGGRATYLFRLDGEVEPALDALNRDLLALNFRREPLLLPEADLPPLRPAALDGLRGRLLGRVAHRSPGAWKEGLLELIAQKGTA